MDVVPIVINGMCFLIDLEANNNFIDMATLIFHLKKVGFLFGKPAL